jgi:phosphoribosylformylglycinamidine cyclo-ligase
VIEDEMRRTFNLGVGLIAVIDAAASARALQVLAERGENAWRLGAIEPAAAEQEPFVEFVRA